MSTLHEVEWLGPAASPQAACARALRERRPFLISVNGSPVYPGDLLMFPAFFAAYPVIRYATPVEVEAIAETASAEGWHASASSPWLVLREAPEAEETWSLKGEAANV